MSSFPAHRWIGSSNTKRVAVRPRVSSHLLLHVSELQWRSFVIRPLWDLKQKYFIEDLISDHPVNISLSFLLPIHVHYWGLASPCFITFKTRALEVTLKHTEVIIFTSKYTIKTVLRPPHPSKCSNLQIQYEQNKRKMLCVDVCAFRWVG